ncbi:GH12 family glycosyl hydrolase domain-containing protein [Burkholderia gladioli]|uniref:GH12 family glycosyl hydrolase domain-containing protein n=1 Tax=Burkholderia gladioli TaxID=28095 RepID=UPI000D006DB9|nr:glycoside hydrolase [Burkholderia gladioli]PRG93999.1 glycoside hydrolase [Burkholderia gladioli]
MPLNPLRRALWLLPLSILLGNTASAQSCISTQYGALAQGSYTIQNDEWGLANNPGGWQQVCTGSAAGNSWSSTWWWATGSGGIKSYPSIYRGWQMGAWSPDPGGFPVQVSSQAPLPTQVSYSMSGNNQYDAAYDLFFSPSTNPGSPSGEMMVWLAYSGNRPAGNLVASGVTLGGMDGSWDVYQGSNGWPVWSFVRTAQTTSFSGKLQPFIYYLAYTKSWLNPSWYTLNTQFGVEVIQSNGTNGSVNVSSFSASAH